MRKRVMLAVLSAMAVPAASQAQQWQLGVRLGYAPAMGNAYESKLDGTAAKMSDGVKAMIPIQLDAGYRITPELTLGAYFSYGFAQLGGSAKDTCDQNGLDCSASDYRLGVQATYQVVQVMPAALDLSDHLGGGHSAATFLASAITWS